MNTESIESNVKVMNRIPATSPYQFREKIRMLSWWTIEAILFRTSLHKMNRFRCFLLRSFGAKIGKNTFIHSRAKIWFPWNLDIGSNAGIGFDALIYNLDRVQVGDFATISQRAHLNTASHDYRDPAFKLITKPIYVGAGAFIGADSYIGPGVSIGEMTVVGARSVVVFDQPEFTVCFGHPCKPHKIFHQKLEAGT